MAEMDPKYRPMASLLEIFHSAKHFGLTDDEVWKTIDASMFEADSDVTEHEYLDELTGALARRILSKERRMLAGERCDQSEERRVLSQEAF
jgi:hypothetical protein